ncbi:MAG: response regulator [Armatimonadota bacterium]
MDSLRREQSRILLVDDTETNIDYLLGILEGEGEISVALDGQTALRSVAETKPDLILLDIMMPGLNGYQVCEMLKRNPETSDIPVMFLTGLADETDQELGLQLGAVDYITKPFNAILVQLRVRHQLELRRHQYHLEEMVSERTQELQKTRDATIASMAILAEYRDNETGAHIQRTMRFVKILAEQLAHRFPDILTPDVIELLGQSASLHDIGKVGIPDAILLKPGRLTKAEFAEMQNHAMLGAEAIRKTELVLGTNSFLKLAHEIAESHHEKWNGSGYPHGLREDNIPISARIMTLADVYDALTSKRPYKRQFTHAEALHIITVGDEHTHPDNFDPLVLDAFVKAEEEFQRIGRLISDQVPCNSSTPEVEDAKPHP